MNLEEKNLPAFVIGIEKNKFYYRRTIKMLAEAGIEAKLWEGIDSDLIQLKEGESIQNWCSYLFRGKPLIRGEIGCYLSHYKLMQYIVEKGYERTVIFEDDVIPSPQLASVLKKIQQLPASYRIIQLGGNHPSIRNDINHTMQHTMAMAKECLVLENTKLYLLFNPSFGAFAYVIHREAIQKLLPQMMPIIKEIDCFLFKPWKTKVSCYFIFSSVAEHDYEKESSIQIKISLFGKIKKLFVRTILTSIRLTYKIYNKRLKKNYFSNLAAKK